MVTQKADVLIFALALLSAYLSKLRVSAGKKQLLSHPLGLGCGRNRGPKGASVNKVTLMMMMMMGLYSWTSPAVVMLIHI